MGGGLMQLVAYGAQDVYLTGNPQITFFKVVYRRHTNFSMESIQQTLNGNAVINASNNRVSSTISRNGDLVGKMHLEVGLTLAGGQGAANIGTALINEVEVEIGGQSIDKHTGHSMEVFSELREKKLAKNFTPAFGANNANANHDNFTQTTNSGGVSAPGAGAAVMDTFYVPLQFWFNRHAGLALPLIALQYHEVKINLTLATQSVVNSGALTSSSINLYADYIYLDTDERRRFAQVSHEYLIEQLQIQLLPSNQVGAPTINLNHPVKELVIAGPGTTGNPGGGTVGISTPLTLANNAAGLSSTTLKLKLNGHDRMAARPLSYFTRTQVYQHHSGVGGKIPGATGTTDSIAVYSFALKPEEHQPSGTCNFSRIDNAQIVIGGNQLCAAATSIPFVYAVNYNVLRIMSGMGGLAYSN